MVEKKKGGAKTKSGGSQASNAVVGGITNSAFKRMNSTAQNMRAVGGKSNNKNSSRKGGSVASDTVTSLSSAEVYKALNTLFTNGVSSSKTGGSCRKHNQKGGFFNNVLGQTTMQVFKNNVRSFAGNSASPYPFNSAAMSTKWNSNVRGNNNTPPPSSNAKAPNAKAPNTRVLNTNIPNTKVNVVKQVAGSKSKRGGSSITNSRLVMNSAGLYPFSDDPLNNPLKNYAIKNNTTTTAIKGGKYKQRGGASNNIYIEPTLRFNEYSKNLQEHSSAESAIANKILASEYIDSFGYIDKSSMYGAIDNASKFSYGQTPLQDRPASIGTSSGNKVNTLSGGKKTKIIHK